MIIFGLNPVLEALAAGSVMRLLVADRDRDRLQEVLRTALARGVSIEDVPRARLDAEAHGGVHQGVVAEVVERRDLSIAELVHASEGPPLIVVLDGLEDPQNVGAILRTVDAAGATGVVRQTRRAAPLQSGVVAKASAGAVAHVRVADVVNIARALEELKALGVWTVGLAAEAPLTYDRVDYSLPTAIVLGAEGSGLRRLVRERCDLLAGIPLHGRVSSLNVSAAAAVVLFEAVRQRQRSSGEADRKLPERGSHAGARTEPGKR